MGHRIASIVAYVLLLAAGSGVAYAGLVSSGFAGGKLKSAWGAPLAAEPARSSGAVQPPAALAAAPSMQQPAAAASPIAQQPPSQPTPDPASRHPLRPSPAAPPTASSTTLAALRPAPAPASTPTFYPAVAPRPATSWWGGPVVAENGDLRGFDNDGDGRIEPVHVRGYTRKDGTYVRGHYRARARR